MSAAFHQTLKDLEKEVTHYLYLLHCLHRVSTRNVLLDGQEGVVFRGYTNRKQSYP